MALSPFRRAATALLDRPSIDALIGCDGKGRITVWNEAAAQLFGYTEEEILGRPYIVLVPPQYRASHELALRTSRGRPPASMMGKSRRWMGLRKDGTQLEFEMSLRWWSVKEGTCIAGRMELSVDTVRLDEMIRETVAQCEGQFRDGVRMISVLPPGPMTVTADGNRLHQVVLNLLSNAIKFTEQGDITVTVRCDDAGAPIRIEVRDTGIGIPPDRTAAIFNSFEQADSGTARRFGGTGLGLAISRSLCEQMGFTLTVASEPGAGSTFIVGLVPHASVAR